MNSNPNRQVPGQTQVHPVGSYDQVSKVESEAAGVLYSIEHEEEAVTPGIDVNRRRRAIRDNSRYALVKLRDILWNNCFRQLTVADHVCEHDCPDLLAPGSPDPRFKLIVVIVRFRLESFGKHGRRLCRYRNHFHGYPVAAPVANKRTCSTGRTGEPIPDRERRDFKIEGAGEQAGKTAHREVAVFESGGAARHVELTENANGCRLIDKLVKPIHPCAVAGNFDARLDELLGRPR